MDARAITHALKGRWHGSYGTARCPAHGDTRPSLSLADGDDGRLLLHCFAGCEFRAVLDAMRRVGLTPGRSDPPLESQARTILRAASASAIDRRSAQAQAVWQESQLIEGTPAATYLRSRGITCPLPSTLGFHPACWHGATAQRLPALVARVDGSSASAVHRTYLSLEGLGKARVEPAKAMLGPVGSGAVRLTQAPHVPGSPLVVAEGIETALSLASGLLSGPATIWAALSAAGMAGLRLPERPGQLIIASDGDTAGRQAAQALARRAKASGWMVRHMPAPKGSDWNDVLVMERRS